MYFESVFAKHRMRASRGDVLANIAWRRCLLNIASMHSEAMFAKYRMEVANMGVDIFTKYGIREAIFSKHRCVS